MIERAGWCDLAFAWFSPVIMVHPESVLFVTLDSCRYDTFEQASSPALKAVAPLRSAQAPGYFTYGSHSAMFVGFTPHVSSDADAFLNPKHAKIFKLEDGGYAGSSEAAFTLQGANIIEGFEAAGYTTLGTGAAGWFDPGTATGKHLSAPFQSFLFDPSPGACERQVAWLEAALEQVGENPVFAFANLAETHVPYWHQGAPWSPSDNTCIPFQTVDRSAECALRQRLCLEHVDAQLKGLLHRFASATTLVCADHGDAWGEDGVWEHGVAHPSVLTVPWLLRLRGRPI